MGSYLSSKSSDILEPESTSPSLGKVEEDSMEPDATLSSERGRLEISPNTVNQEEGTKVDFGYIHNSYFFHSPSSSYAKHSCRRFTVGTFRVSS